MYLRLTANFYTAKSDMFQIVKSEKKTHYLKTYLKMFYFHSRLLRITVSVDLNMRLSVSQLPIHSSKLKHIF